MCQGMNASPRLNGAAQDGRSRRHVYATSPKDWRHLDVEVGREPAIVDSLEIPAAPWVSVVVLASGASRFEERDPHGPWSTPIDLRPGDVFVTGPMRPAELRWRGLSDDPIESVIANLDLGFLHRRAGEADLDPERLEIVDRSAADDLLLSNLVLSLRSAVGARTKADRLMADGIATTIAAQLLRAHATTTLRDRTGEERLSPAVVRRVQAFIEENLADDLSLEALAGVAAVSVFHFARAFRASTGTTPHEAVTQARIRRAAELLAQTDLSVLQVALAVGYQSQSRFGVQFKQRCVVTPMAFRRR